MQKPSQSFLIRFAFQPTTKSPSVSPTPAVRYSVRNKSSTTHFLITLAFYFLSAANVESLEGRRNKVANHKPYRCTCPRPSCFSFWLPCKTHHLFQAPSLAPTTDSVSVLYRWQSSCLRLILICSQVPPPPSRRLAVRQRIQLWCLAAM